MLVRKLAAIAILAAASTPGLAFDFADPGPSTIFYVSIPLDARLPRKEREFAYGLQLRGRDFHAFQIDTRMLHLAPRGGLEIKWVITGVVASGAAIAIARKDKVPPTPTP
jgi:hypothetical protein